MRCHYIYDKIAGKVLIPGCMGTAARGIENCTCRDIETYTQYEKRICNETVADLQQTIKELEEENAYLNRQMRKLLNK